MFENQPKEVQNIILEKTCKNKSCWKLNLTFYICLTHHHTLHTVYLDGRVGLYPPRIPDHNIFIFVHFGSADPKQFSHLFGHNKLEKVKKFHCYNPSSFLVIDI